jgi:GMP synthase (glutamine-hydrolysing)
VVGLLGHLLGALPTRARFPRIRATVGTVVQAGALNLARYCVRVPTARLLAVQLDPSDPPARLGAWLRAAGLDLDVRALDAGDELPADLAGHAGLLVLGGKMGALDDHDAPFLPAVRSLLREAVATEVPTLGVCLGHQLLAVANGGQVRRIPGGPEIGALLVAKRGVASNDPLFASLPITPDVIQWHYDEVSSLPPGAIQLFSSPSSDQQAFRLGRLAWGIQFHIETTPDLLRSWAQEEADGLAGYDLDLVLARALAVDADLVEVWQPFAANFADIVRDPSAVAPVRGVPTSTSAPVTDPAAIRAALAAELRASRTGLPMPGLRPPDD